MCELFFALKTIGRSDIILPMPYLTGGNLTLEEGGEIVFEILTAIGTNVVGTVIGGLIVSYIVKKWF